MAIINEQTIIDTLSNAPAGLTALQISQAIVGKENGRAKLANPVIYKMSREGKLAKLGEEGRRPVWAIEKAPETTDKEYSFNITEKEVVDMLGVAQRDITSLELAKNIVGSAGRAKMTNPILYSLRNRGLVEMNQAGNGKTSWRATKTSYSLSPILTVLFAFLVFFYHANTTDSNITTLLITS